MVQQYLTALDVAVAPHPELHRCVVSCVHCGIRFLTTPQNVGRRNLRCPFGCRPCHRRQSSHRRSAAYYRTPQGKRKKQRLNARRGRRAPSAAGPQQDLSPQTPPANESPTDERPPTVELGLEGPVLDESEVARSPMLPYVRTVIRLLEGVELTRAEIVGRLHEAVRQHRIGGQRRIPYASSFPQQHPP